MKEQRNAPCSCGSGKKFKNCCGREKVQRSFWHFKSNIIMVVLGLLFFGVMIYGYVDYLKTDPVDSSQQYCPDCGKYH